MNKHTPIPWTNQMSMICIPEFDDSENEGIIGSCIKIEDAKFIVKAVNCHAELLAKLKEWRAYLILQQGAFLEDIDKLIAKAETE